jgi:radical SAM protein with 4Fe4S-binding SPASM domain
MNNFVPLNSLRLQRQIAPASAYQTPEPGMLAKSIIEGKRKLDQLTQNELSGVSEANRLAAPAVCTADGEFNISRDAPLPLPGQLSHRFLAPLHLWIGVEEGIAIVLNEAEHALFLHLRDGQAPEAVVHSLGAKLSLEARWNSVNELIARLALGGFIRGVESYTDRWEPTPRRFMRLHLTQRCNLACVHCYADSSPFVSSDGEMSVERWLRIIDDFADAGGERVLFTGGEALVFRGCDQLLDRAHERGLDVTLFSNGILIDRFLDVIRECVDQVQISIDGPNPETNDPIRGVGSFHRAKKAVDTLLNAGVRVRISMVVMEQNIEAMRVGFVPFAKQWDGKPLEWRLGYGVAHHGRGAEIGDTLEIHDVRPIVDKLLEEVEGDGGPRIARSTKTCGYAEQIVIAPDGSVHPCHLLDGAITHIDDQSMVDLIGLVQKTAHEYDVDQSIGCNRCDIRNLCGGSCRVQNGKATGNRRVTNCTAFDKLHRLNNLVQTFSESPIPAVPEGDWE